MLSWLLAIAVAAEPVDPFEEPDESELFEFDAQLVTVASRYAQTLKKAPSIVTVVDEEQIRERGYRTLSDLLREIPGIYIWKSKEGRDLAAVRGVISADNNKILLLVDGVPWYDGVYTSAMIDDSMPMSHIRQVEVIKGPGSAIYGTNAFAAVINVVTRDGNAIDGAYARWMVGSRGRSDALLSVGGRTRAGGLEVDASGYVRLLGQLGDGLDVTPRNRHDINGLDVKDGVAVGGQISVEGLQLQLHHTDYRHTFLINEADDPWDLLGKSIDDYGLYYYNTSFAARYAAELSRSITLTPHLWAQRYDNPGSYFFFTGDTLDSVTTVETEKDTQRWALGVDFEGRPALDHVIVAGLGMESVSTVDHGEQPGIIDIEYDDLETEGTSTGFEGTGVLRNLYVYGQYTWTITAALEVMAGGRVDLRVPTSAEDDPTAAIYQPTPTPRLGVLFAPSSHFSAKLLYGSAFRQPNIRELLVTTSQREPDGNYEFANGNVNLRPERIETIEAEMVYQPTDQLEFRVDGEYAQLRNEIDKVTPPNEYRNLPGGLDMVSVEAGLTSWLGPVELSGAYALTDARYTANAGPYAGRVQYEYPPHQVKGHARYKVTDALSATVFGELYTYRPRVEWTPSSRLDDGRWFALIHANARVAKIGRDGRFGLDVTVRNLLDTPWGTGSYRDDADLTATGGARYPNEIEGEGRSVTVALEGRL